jgi:hypothetical protein
VNAAGNKLDTYLETVVDGRLDGRGQSWTITLTNNAPSDLPGYVQNNVAPDVETGTNRSWVSFYSSNRIAAATRRGEPVPLTLENEHGLSVTSMFVDIPPGESMSISYSIEGRQMQSTLDLYSPPLAIPPRWKIQGVDTDGSEFTMIDLDFSGRTQIRVPDRSDE